MDKLRVRFGPTLLVVTILLLVLGACGPGEESATPGATPTPTPTPSPGGNQPPVISSLTSAEAYVSPKSITEVRCIASDPDDDPISYEWATTGGDFSGSGSTLSWVAPDEYGDWDITVTVEDDKGGVAQSTIRISVVSNQGPVISSLAANPTVLLPQGKSTITCIASDPEGDVLTYSWEASGGEITGVGDAVTWIAPDREGDFTVTVFVDDDKGGRDLASVSLTVALTEVTESFNPLAAESGTVSSTGDKDTSRSKAGDDADNVGYRAFWSFDLYSLRGTDVKEAKLTFTTHKVIGDPFLRGTGLRGLYLWQIRDDSGTLPDYNTEPVKELTELLWELPEVVDVTEEVSRIGKGLSPSDRLQVRAGFVSKTNGTATDDFIDWDSAVLTVTYARK